MARKAKPTDFPIRIDGVGTFIFGRRTFGDHANIRADYIILTKGQEDNELAAYALFIANMRHLCVKCPLEWEAFETMELTDERIDTAFEILEKLEEQEKSFRSGATIDGKAQGQGALKDVQPVVQENIRSAAD